jgi:hypothetical protein
MHGMPGRESAASDGRSCDIDQAEIVYLCDEIKFARYFKVKCTISTGEMHLQIENCMIGINGDTVAFSVWQRCDIRH